MAIRFACTSCGREFAMPERHGGRKFRCPDCDTKLWVPRETSAQSPAPRAQIRRGQPPHREKGSHLPGTALEDDEIGAAVSAQDLLGSQLASGSERSSGRPTGATGERPGAGASRRRRPWWALRFALLCGVLWYLWTYLHSEEQALAEAVLLNDRGVELETANKLPEAIAVFERAIELDPDFFEAHYNLGNAYDAAHQAEASLPHFRAAAALDPDHAPARFGLGAALYKTGQYEEALRHLDEALRLDPAHGEAHLYRSYTLYKTGRYLGAWVALKEAYRLEAHFHGEYVRALKQAMEREGLSPDDAIEASED